MVSDSIPSCFSLINQMVCSEEIIYLFPTANLWTHVWFGNYLGCGDALPEFKLVSYHMELRTEGVIRK